MSRLKGPQRREQLVAVATRLFAKSGYEATTTAAIAEAAGVTEPILYRHFKNKRAMFVAIVRAMSDATVQQWHRLIEGISDPAHSIRRIAEEFTVHIHELADAYRVIHGALATSNDRRVIAVIRKHYVHIERFFSEIIKRGQQLGHFRTDMDPRVPAWQLISIGIGYAMIALNLEHFDDSLIGQAIESIMRGIKK